ncbi:MAG: hypothetical protein ACRD2B_12385, partial [Terriglobia bacterium]
YAPDLLPWGEGARRRRADEGSFFHVEQAACPSEEPEATKDLCICKYRDASVRLSMTHPVKAHEHVTRG